MASGSGTVTHKFSSLRDLTDKSWDYRLGDNVAREADTSGAGEHSEAEIAQYTVDDSQSEIQKFQQFAAAGQPIQRYAAVDSLPRLLRMYGSDACQPLLEDLAHTLPIVDTDTQMHAANIYRNICSSKLLGYNTSGSHTSSTSDQPQLSHHHYQQVLTVFQTIQAMLEMEEKRSVGDSSQWSVQENVATVWLEPLEVLLPSLNPQQLTSLVEFARRKGDIAQSVQSRYICVRLYGLIASYMSPTTVRTYVQHALTCCQDTSAVIRQTSCMQLNGICRALAGNQATLTNSSHQRHGSNPVNASADMIQRVLSEVDELLHDEEVEVQCAALTALIDMLDLVPPTVRATRTIPLLKQYLAPVNTPAAATATAPTGNSTGASPAPMTVPKPIVHTLATMFGTLLVKLKPEIDTTNDTPLTRTLCAFYKSLPTLSAVEHQPTRYATAYNLPAVVQLLGTQRYAEGAQAVLRRLARDDDENIRRCVAASLHEVVKLLGNKSFSLTKDTVLTLLRDSSATVTSTLLSSFSQIMHTYITDSEEYPVVIYNDVLKAIVAYDSLVASSWRLKCAWLQQAQTWPKLFADDLPLLYDRIMPLILHNLSHGTHPVRLQAAHTFCVYLRCQPMASRRTEMVSRLQRDFCQARNYLQRVTFLELAAFSIQHFSYRWFKKTLIALCFSLVSDKVIDVRRALAALLPTLQLSIQLPADTMLNEQLQKTTNTLRNDRDPSVVETVQQSQQIIMKHDLRFISSLYPSEAERENKKKEEDEDAMIRQEEESVNGMNGGGSGNANGKSVMRAPLIDKRLANVQSRIDTGLGKSVTTAGSATGSQPPVTPRSSVSVLNNANNNLQINPSMLKQQARNRSSSVISPASTVRKLAVNTASSASVENTPRVSYGSALTTNENEPTLTNLSLDAPHSSSNTRKSPISANTTPSNPRNSLPATLAPLVPAVALSDDDDMLLALANPAHAATMRRTSLPSTISVSPQSSVSPSGPASFNATPASSEKKQSQPSWARHFKSNNVSGGKLLSASDAVSSKLALPRIGTSSSGYVADSPRPSTTKMMGSSNLPSLTNIKVKR